ncbi:MAG: hypothetical protein GY813_09820, partial [Halieaceae bacterium]|nr:hypothetical protein [Halieaceae bacterium]
MPAIFEQEVDVTYIGVHANTTAIIQNTNPPDEEAYIHGLVVKGDPAAINTGNGQYYADGVANGK